LPIQNEVFEFEIGFQQAVHPVGQRQVELLEDQLSFAIQVHLETWCSVRLQAGCLQELF
jgi:hypothetical protein